MNARSEPLLWLQLIAVGVLPLEALLLLLLLAGSDPGPVPGLERLLCWGLGGLLPAVALWRRPADVWSLLLLQIPLRARRPLQQRLSSLQESAALRIGLVVGSALLLALLWWSDEHAAIAGPFSPLAASPRLVGLLLAALLLALMLWQWQQLLQSLWLLSRGSDTLAAAEAMTSRELEARRLCLGLPLLLLDPLVAGTASRPRAETGTEPAAAKPGPLEPTAPAAEAKTTPKEARSEETPAAGAPAENRTESGPGQPGPSAAVPVAIEPEQGAEDGEGGDLDQQVG
ncbi:MAG: low-complexity tail membrane protein [Cyanobacteria bacterium]|nr:low-complexity tail membrane protein [Cyanobacteriota bacterium]